MSSVIVTGYADGIAYGVHLDDETDDALSGIIVSAPSSIVSAIDAMSGEEERLHHTGRLYTIGVHTIEGVLAYLIRHTEVVDHTGDLPEDLTGSDDDVADAVQ